jgi:uncharacterized repeat protein (TIGR03803 family)
VACRLSPLATHPHNLRAFVVWIVCALAFASCSRATESSPLPGGLPNGAATLGIEPPQQRAGSAKYQVLFNFGSSVDGYYGTYPSAGLININGTLYGTTSSGGAPGYNGRWGTVFSITTTGTETVLHTFSDNDGAIPDAGLIDVNGTLYGTTSAGGIHSGGTVFSLSLTGQNFRVLHTFTGGSDGKYPMAGLIAVKGNLYGTTYQGGTQNEGAVYSVRIADGKERVLHSFTDIPDGQTPLADLIDVEGTLYGTTELGGRGGGTVFSVTKTGDEHVVYSFGSPPDGNAPVAGLVAVKGTLYGTTYQGGAYGFENGTVFSVSTTGEEHVLHSFSNDPDGAKPAAGMIAVNGALYGTTQQGGAASAGTLFRIKTNGKDYRVLHSFSQSYTNDGIFPEAALLALNGILYGTTNQGGISLPSCINEGTCDYGTVFELTP